MSYICDGQKYKYDKHGYLFFPIQLPSLPETVVIDGIKLSLKTSFHVSLICVKQFLEFENIEERAVSSFCAFAASHEVSFVRFTGEFRLAQFEGRKSLVALCEISNIDLLFKFLSKELGVEVPPQPTHVTLYTLQKDVGIGLNSDSEMKSKSTKVDVSSFIKSALV